MTHARTPTLRSIDRNTFYLYVRVEDWGWFWGGGVGGGCSCSADFCRLPTYPYLFLIVISGLMDGWVDERIDGTQSGFSRR